MQNDKKKMQKMQNRTVQQKNAAIRCFKIGLMNTLQSNTLRCKKFATIVSSGSKNSTQPFVRQNQVSTRAINQQQNTSYRQQHIIFRIVEIELFYRY